MSDVVSSSFRDPSGFVFFQNDILYRQVNTFYQIDFDDLHNTGLYSQLVDKRYLVSHEEVDVEPPGDDAYKIIKPEQVETISYPCEWSFSQLKDAALLTLDIQKLALEHDMVMKDASAYNVQFHHGRAIFIDTLSFEAYEKGLPWVAYGQFCRHFLAPLALMSKTDINLSQLLRTNIDGIPLGLASKLLPFKTRFSFFLGVHIHLHARLQSVNTGKRLQEKPVQAANKFSKKALLELIDSLRSGISKLQWSPGNTEWHDYYQANNNYRGEGHLSKDDIVESFMVKNPCHTCWDFGANTGRYSKIAGRHSEVVYAWDIDPACVEIHYLELKKASKTNILPLLLDLMNPTPAYGWNNDERMSIHDRGPVDMVLALGLVHHLAISNNLPLDKIAKFFNGLTTGLIVEFVPKSDSQVKKLLQSRKDIFPTYNKEGFISAFSRYFNIEESVDVVDTERTLYLLSKI